ncbi:universal stress protein [Actinospica acidithermotolerans]|uniref:universal stress protein n=1 Tax=Actinospica acidithermotolerans TaxID=2828514 RepID=UPI003557D921
MRPGGPVAAAVRRGARSAHRPRPRGHRARRRTAAGSRGRPLRPAARRAAGLARLRGAGLAARRAQLRGSTAARLRGRGSRAGRGRDAAARRGARHYPGVRAIVETACDAPAPALLLAAKDAQMLVLGAHGRSGGVPRVGSTVYEMLVHCPVPVAIVPSAA